MASGSGSNSDPIEPTEVWTAEEWRQDQKRRLFQSAYSGGPLKFYGAQTGRFKVKHPPMDFKPREGSFNFADLEERILGMQVDFTVFDEGPSVD